MRVLIFGATGMLGHKLYQELGREFDVWGTIRGDTSKLDRYGFYETGKIVPHIDASDTPRIREVLQSVKPDVVLNAVGVVKQVPEGNDPLTALSTNAVFPHNLAMLTRDSGARLITISTDCVFSGEKGNYVESDMPDATDIYGVSKRLGEVNEPHALTLRTSIIGRELGTRHGLVEWFLSNRGKAVDGYCDAIFSGLPTAAVSSAIEHLITAAPDLSGLYHLSADPISKYDLLVGLDRAFATATEIRSSHELKIDRSLDSSALRSATGWEPPGWDEMIDAMVADPTPYDRWQGSGDA